jgi:hypothetical protein
MRGLSLAFLGVLVSSVALAQEPAKRSAEAPDAKAIVQKSADALAKLKLVAYDLEYKVTGFFGAFLPNISGRVVMGKESPDGAKRFRCNVKIQRDGSSEVTEVSAGADGKTYYLIDDKTKTVHADIDPQVFGNHRDPIDFTLTREFGMARPFEDALKSGQMRYEREEQVEGHDCHVVFFKSAATTPEMEWYFSKTDSLPRRVRFAMKDPEGNEGSGTATMHKLMVDPKLQMDPFALVVPEGYRRTDDFAP